MWPFNRDFGWACCFFNPSNDLGVNAKPQAGGHNGFSRGLVGVDLQAMAHVEHLVHLFPRRARLLLNGLKQHGNVHHVVFDHVQARVQKVKHLGLCTARAMDHAVNLRPVFLQESLHHRSVGSRR